MQRDTLRRSFKRLGIPAKDYKVLKLLPLIYVAWADGKIEALERSRIHSYAARHYDLSASGVAVLSRWLNAPPDHDYIAEALRDIYFLARAPDDLEVDFSELPALLSYAEGVARTTADALDQPASVTPEEEKALEELAQALHIDHGQSWAKLLRDLN
jgi:tellurite resistance protein